MSTRVHEPAPAPAARALTPAPRLLVQRDAASAVAVPATAPDSVHRALSSPGRPLDPDTRGYMESRFGHDFSRVRVHTDTPAAESAREIDAHAYTVGSDIAFAAGRYQPETQAGRQLLAHELAHTIQQEGLQRRASDLSVDVAPDSRLESEADAAARAVASGYSAPAIAARAPGPVVSRAKGDITTAPATAPKKKPFTTSTGTHQVMPTGLGTLETDNKGNTDTLREYEVEPFFLPATKGPAAFAIYDSMAKGGSLESTLELTGTGKTKTALWQERPVTDDLRDIWLQKAGWTGADSKTVNDLWQRAGGASEFPKVNSATGLVTAQMDHIVELQIGGNNTKENIQPLDPTPNQSSGGAIKSQLQSLAQAIAADTAFAGPDTQQVKMRFKSVKQVGTPETLVTSAPAPNAKRSALSVEARALTLKVTATAGGGVAIARDDYPISSGGRPPTNLRVPTTFAATASETVPIKGDSENDPASTLIPGLLLNTLKHGKVGKTKSDLIEAQIDDRDKTRLPLTLDSAVKPFDLTVAADGKLSLPTALKKTSLGFTYKYLSPGTINSIEMGADGTVNWTGKITPTAKFLPTLDVIYKDGNLKLVAQIPEEKLKKAKLFGATVTKASLDIALSPFDISGNLEFVFGDVKKPAATGALKIFKDDQGLVGTAKLLLHIPKVDSTEITFEYKGGAERDEWSGQLAISTSQIKLPYVTNSSIVARVSSKAGVTTLTFDGKVSLELPNKRGTAEVGLKRWGDNWFFAGGARLNIPKVEDFSAWITYDIARETLTASVPGEDGKAPPKPIGFTITEDFKGTLDRFKITIAKGGAVTVTGAGGFNFKKGKASGVVRVELAEDGSFNGSGSLTYALNDKITVAGSVEFKEKGKPKLRITGSLTFARLELMKQMGDTKTLFDKEFSIPIPYASIGGVGLKAIFGVNLTAGYSLGPIVIEPLTFTAGFNPLEDEPQLDLGVTGQLKVPASATLSASLSGGVKLDAYVAEIGGKITITGTVELTGGLFVPFKGTYSNQEFAVEMTPEARLKLLLGVALSATVWAKAGVGWLSTGVTKTWKLGERKVDPHLGFGIKAPISYSSKKGANIPSLDQITFVPPDFSRENLSRVADELFGAAAADPADA